MTGRREEHLADQGLWPVEFPRNEDGGVEEGLVVWSRLAIIEGRTTGKVQRCRSYGCAGWFIGVNWESEEFTRWPCSAGWTYDPISKSIRITAGGEISARAGDPPPEGTDPTPRWAWPDRSKLGSRMGWRVTGTAALEVP
jgi:hypothetical protein